MCHSLDYEKCFVSGTIWLQLCKGNFIVKGKTSLTSLYHTDLASMDKEGGGNAFVYNTANAQGFSRINAIRLKTHASLSNKYDC